MKRILLACFLVFATCTVVAVQHATAQTAPAVTQTSFMAKVNTMDAQIGAGNLTAAQTTWESIHADMLTVLGVTKNSIRTAATPADEASYYTVLNNQTAIYRNIWQMHTDLATNRASLLTKLTDFSTTIY